jgi:hypothetical protein
MDWNTASAISQVVGAVAVVASLLYLGRQVRQTNALARAEAYRAVSVRMSELLTVWATDAEFLRIAHAGIFEHGLRLNDLTPEDRTRAAFHFSAALRVFEMIHRQVEAGVLREDAYGMIGGIMFRSPLFQDVWRTLRVAYAPDLVAVIDDRLSSVASVTPDDLAHRVLLGAETQLSAREDNA